MTGCMSVFSVLRGLKILLSLNIFDSYKLLLVIAGEGGMISHSDESFYIDQLLTQQHTFVSLMCSIYIKK